MRVLRRPMFRIGGSAGEGITSGLVPRQGYNLGKLAEQKISNVFSGDMTFGEADKLSKLLAYKPRGVTPADALIEFGLNVASAPPTGSIFSTAAGAAKEPFQRYAQSKASAAEKAYASQSDLFKQILESAGGDEKTYAHRDKAKMVRENMNSQNTVYDKIAALDKEAPDYNDKREELMEELRILKEQVSGDEFAKAQMQYWNQEQNRRKLDSWIKREIQKELNVPFDPENNDHANRFMKRRNEVMNEIRLGISPTFNFATGGRVGYQQGLSVQPQPVSMQPQIAQPEMQMPEEITSISFEELRQRLPAEVTDDIVRLIASSGEAMEDFATIETEQDIANFNKKYGVNLVLPAEG